MRISRRLLLLVAALFVASSSVSAQVTTTINFNNGTLNGAVGSTYSSQGVTFLNAEWGDYLGGQDGLGNKLADGVPYPNNPGNWLYGCCSIHKTDGIYTVSPANPILAYFSTAMQSVSLRGLDISFLGYRLTALDDSFAPLSSASTYGPNSGGVDQLLTVSGSNIWGIAFSQDIPGTPGTDGIAFDDLSFTTSAAPEPATILLVAPALLGFGILARRRAR